jgi:hypothetical protein
MSSSLLDSAIVFFAVFAALIAFDVYLSRRREKRILSETAVSVQEARGHTDAQLLEARKRSEAYQERIFALMEEHNTLLRDILSELKRRAS